VAKLLIDNNHQVDILTGLPNYPDGELFSEYKLDKKKFNNFYGASVFRVPIFLRRDSRKIFLFFNYISFILSSIIYGLFLLRNKKYHIVISFATTPLTSSLSALFFSKIKSCKSFVWVLDIWPDILLELKILKKNIFYIIIEVVSKFIYKNFDYILVQSKSFKKIIAKYNNADNNIIYFPSWAEDTLTQDKIIKNSINNEIIKKYKNDKSFKIVFTGNVGESQNFDQVIKAANYLKNHDDIKWIIVGSGRELINIKKLIIKKNINNFILEGKKKLNDVSYYHSIADILFVSLKSGPSISSTIPGKLQTYLKSNKFILGMISGETKKIINESRIGSCVNPNSPHELAKKILYLKDNPEIYQKVNNSNLGQEYLEKYFNRNLIFQDLIISINKAYNSIEKIRLIRNASEIPFDKNFSLSGLNLAFLGYLSSKKINLHDHLFNWPDGIFKSRFYGRKLSKIAGSSIINNLVVPSIIEKIYILGKLTKLSNIYLIKKFPNCKIIHIDLPFDTLENIYKCCPKDFSNKDLIICTLPTPKQEQLAELIAKNNKYFKIICIGGAVAIASGSEKKVPKILDKLNLEFLWRLRTDTRRRFLRLFYTFYYYLYGELTFRYNRIRFNIYNEKN
jgi:exopolysaccharide biosynthesis WecB/TagA/CpsF family protein